MSSYTPDHEGIGEMLRAEFMQQEMERRANIGKDFAEATAPYDEHDGDHYKDKFHVVLHPEHDRARADLVNDDEAAFQIEFGTRHSPRHRTLGKSMDVMERG